MAWLNFLDLRSLPAKEAEAVILPIPYEATTSYGAGTRQGPEAILAASRQVELWDEDYDWDPSAAIRLATAAPIFGRLVLSRSPPQPKTVITLPCVTSRTASKSRARAERC